MKKVLNYVLLFITFTLLMVLVISFYVNKGKEEIPVDINYLPDIEVTNFRECLLAAYPILESFPRRCKTPKGELFVEEFVDDMCAGMNINEAFVVAQNSECGVKLGKNYFCNEGTKTWWIDLTVKKENCNPACVVNTEDQSTEINWRCTGLVLE